MIILCIIPSTLGEYAYQLEYCFSSQSSTTLGSVRRCMHTVLIPTISNREYAQLRLQVLYSSSMHIMHGRPLLLLPAVVLSSSMHTFLCIILCILLCPYYTCVEYSYYSSSCTLQSMHNMQTTLARVEYHFARGGLRELVNCIHMQYAYYAYLVLLV